MLLIVFFLLVIHQRKSTPGPVPKFEAQVIDSTISIGYGLALGDVDGDGKPDILLADKKQFAWYRNGDWKRFVMIENLTEHDNVCIAARDLDGDGKVEVAVGAQWNPGETANPSQSGSVHFLIRPIDPKDEWKMTVLDHSMHLTHNLDIVEGRSSGQTDLYIAGKEGIKLIPAYNNKSGEIQAQKIQGVENSAGEVRIGNPGMEQSFIATIEPMHGVAVAVYAGNKNKTRVVLDDQLKEGHALATADLLGLGYDQVVAGWRGSNAANKTGIKLYVPRDKRNMQWDQYWIDENGIATEDIQVMDMNSDGKPDIIAAGRATKNLKIYWNRSE